jgi:hypothetical protein
MRSLIKFTLYPIIVLFQIFLLSSCYRDSSKSIIITPISTIKIIEKHEQINELINAAKFYGLWASGYPYPIFFINAPIGLSKMKLEDVRYDDYLLGDSHPALKSVRFIYKTPENIDYELIATDFTYNSESSLLINYSAYVNKVKIDTQGYDVSLAPGIGLSFLGDVGGINLFYNCQENYHLDYSEIDKSPSGLPLVSEFKWQCMEIKYIVRVSANWNENFQINGKIIPIIQNLEAEFDRH